MKPTSQLRALVTALSLCTATTVSAQGYSHVVAFGDSLTDRGNTYAAAYAMGATGLIGYDQMYYEADHNRFGIEAAGRFSSGPTWVEYLNGKIINGASTSTPLDLGANGGFNDPTSHATNFAWAGSVAGDPGWLPIPSLTQQVTRYQANTVLAPHIGTTLFTVWSGGNDAIAWADGNNHDDAVALDNLTTTVVNAIAHSVETLHLGGGTSFLIPNLPALGWKPNYNDELERRDAANAFVAQYNSKLQDWLDNGAPLGATIFRLDVYSAFEEIRLFPERFGLSIADAPAYIYDANGSTTVPNPETYVFWDNTHPTAQVHEILGNLAYQAVYPIPEPSSMILLGAGAAFAFAQWSRRRAA